MSPSTRSTRRTRGRRTAAVAVIAATLTVGGAGAALAANPYSSATRAVEDALGAVGLEWSAMPEGYTREQYEAFWGAGYTSADAEALAALWGSDVTTAKARAGQALIDGEEVPVPPSTAPGSEDPAAGDAAAGEARLDAFWDAGYTYGDAEALAALWGTDLSETKARAGQALIDGQTLPVAPGTTTSAS